MKSFKQDMLSALLPLVENDNIISRFLQDLVFLKQFRQLRQQKPDLAKHNQLVEILHKYEDFAALVLSTNPALYMDYPHVLLGVCRRSYGKASSLEEFENVLFNTDELAELREQGISVIDKIRQREKDGELLIIESKGEFYIFEL
jgi:hypothetical protein